MPTTIKFNRAYSPYCCGDVATFPDRAADNFVRAGYANRQMTADGPVGQRPSTDPLPRVPATPARPEPASEADSATVKPPVAKEPEETKVTARVPRRVRASKA